MIRRCTNSSRPARRASLANEDPGRGRGEYSDFLSTLSDLKQGKTDMFAELVNKAMTATSNIKHAQGHARWSLDNSALKGQSKSMVN